MKTSRLPTPPDPELLLLLLLHADRASAAVATIATADAIRRDRRMVNSFRRIRPRRRILCVGDCKAGAKGTGISCHELPHCRRCFAPGKTPAPDDQLLRRATASGVAGVKKLIRLPSGSRKSRERLPHGIVVGALTNSIVAYRSRSYSASTSSTRNSMMAVWLSAGRAEPTPNNATVRGLPSARVPAGGTHSGQ